MENTKWVSTWANATSIITRQVENYTKDITLRYPIKSAFNAANLDLVFLTFVVQKASQSQVLLLQKVMRKVTC